jgi:AraC-like DNA-binding protein
MHSRTLKRRLRIVGTSLRKLVNETQFEVARQLLVGTRMPITDIALALQYADSSGFTRAFRTRAGISPSAWRDRSSVGAN